MNPSSGLVVNHASALSGAELCLLDFVPAFDAGSEAFLFAEGPLRFALAARGMPVTISRSSTNFASIKKDQSLIRAIPHTSGLISIIGEVARRARGHGFLYANSQKAFVVSAFASIIARRPLIWHLHDILSQDHFGLAQRKLVVGLANHLAKVVIVPSIAASRAFVESGGKASIVRTVANGVDQTNTGKPPPSRAALGLPQGALFGVFSRISPWKGQHIAIQALAEIPNAHCVIVGDSLFGEEDYARELRNIAAQLGVTNRVIFLGHRSDVIDIMTCVDVVVHPSTKPEPFGRTFVEAMLARVPIIAGDGGAAPEILDHGKFGYLIPPNDALALATQLRKIFLEGRSAQGFLDEAYVRATTEYNVKSMVDKIKYTLHGALA